MFCTVRAGAPLSVVSVGSSLASAGAAGAASREVREDCLLAETSARGLTSLVGVVFLAGGGASALAAGAAFFYGALSLFFSGAFSLFFSVFTAVSDAPLAEPLDDPLLFLK